mmetsp:Transcript_5724/g.10104  ORF Transcript_5724/g.10104 Transcript_5724/m.10104 type:complete len:419 (-) Transcript_5724:565-1821(-)
MRFNSIFGRKLVSYPSNLDRKSDDALILNDNLTPRLRRQSAPVIHSHFENLDLFTLNDQLCQGIKLKTVFVRLKLYRNAVQGHDITQFLLHNRMCSNDMECMHLGNELLNGGFIYNLCDENDLVFSVNDAFRFASDDRSKRMELGEDQYAKIKAEFIQAMTMIMSDHDDECLYNSGSVRDLFSSNATNAAVNKVSWSFSGEEAVSWLWLSEYVCHRRDGWRLCQEFMNDGVFIRVSGFGNRTFQDNNTQYCFEDEFETHSSGAQLSFRGMSSNSRRLSNNFRGLKSRGGTASHAPSTPTMKEQISRIHTANSMVIDSSPRNQSMNYIGVNSSSSRVSSSVRRRLESGLSLDSEAKIHSNSDLFVMKNRRVTAPGVRMKNAEDWKECETLFEIEECWSREIEVRKLSRQPIRKADRLDA